MYKKSNMTDRHNFNCEYKPERFATRVRLQFRRLHCLMQISVNPSIRLFPHARAECRMHEQRSKQLVTYSTHPYSTYQCDLVERWSRVKEPTGRTHQSWLEGQAEVDALLPLSLNNFVDHLHRRRLQPHRCPQLHALTKDSCGRFTP